MPPLKGKKSSNRTPSISAAAHFYLPFYLCILANAQGLWETCQGHDSRLFMSHTSVCRLNSNAVPSPNVSDIWLCSHVQNRTWKATFNQPEKSGFSDHSCSRNTKTIKQPGVFGGNAEEFQLWWFMSCWFFSLRLHRWCGEQLSHSIYVYAPLALRLPLAASLKHNRSRNEYVLNPHHNITMASHQLQGNNVKYMDQLWMVDL